MLYLTESRSVGVRHIIFCFGLLTFLAASLATAALSTGPIILGTEMNTDGLVEYLCLGNGCEDFTAIRWQD